MSLKIKVAIADDHGLMRQGIASMLEGLEDVEVIGIVEGGEEAINLTATTVPDVFLMDVVMKGMSGIEATKWIKDSNPSIKIIIISGEVSKDFITRGIKAGISGYLPKDVDKDTLVEAIRTVMRGEHFFKSEVMAHIIEDFGDSKHRKLDKPNLTKRETEILKCIAQGLSLKEVADLLFISLKTVETHKLNIQSKLNLSNIAQLVRYAIENNLVAISKPK